MLVSISIETNYCIIICSAVSRPALPFVCGLLLHLRDPALCARLGLQLGLGPTI